MLALSAERGGDPDRPGKKDPLDPLLWRAARPGEPSWDSDRSAPAGPGWHVECAAIALDRLGPAFDVQGGGSDLLFPHHEMSAAHAEVATGEWPFARAYVHAGMVGLDGEKMSKSRGNLVLVSRLRESGTDPTALRLALLAAHYRADRDWSRRRWPRRRGTAGALAAGGRAAGRAGRRRRCWTGCASGSPTTWTRRPRWPRWTGGRTRRCTRGGPDPDAPRRWSATSSTPCSASRCERAGESIAFDRIAGLVRRDPRRDGPRAAAGRRSWPRLLPSAGGCSRSASAPGWSRPG